MSFAGTLTITIGIIIFLVGYWFTGKSSGQKECKEKPENTDLNYGGGIAGIVIGLILMIAGLFINLSSATPTYTPTYTDNLPTYTTTYTDTTTPYTDLPSYEESLPKV